MIIDEKEIVLKAKKDPEAFTLLYDKYFPMINRFVYHKVCGEHEEEARRDIVSNVFFKAMKNLFKFKYLHKGSFSGWLYRIAINEINNYFRFKKKQQTLHENVIINNVPETSDSEKKIQEITYDKLRNAIQKLTDKEQNIIILRYFEKKSNSEIAVILKKSEGAVKVQVHRAMKKLKHIMEMK